VHVLSAPQKIKQFYEKNKQKKLKIDFVLQRHQYQFIVTRNSVSDAASATTITIVPNIGGSKKNEVTNLFVSL
jgi:Uri superfamily endonuclease